MQSLPLEIICNIFHFISPTETPRLSTVSKLWNQANKESLLAKHYIDLYFKEELPAIQLSVAAKEDPDWHKNLRRICEKHLAYLSSEAWNDYLAVRSGNIARIAKILESTDWMLRLFRSDRNDDCFFDFICKLPEPNRQNILDMIFKKFNAENTHMLWEEAWKSAWYGEKSHLPQFNVSIPTKYKTGFTDHYVPPSLFFATLCNQKEVVVNWKKESIKNPFHRVDRSMIMKLAIILNHEELFKIAYYKAAYNPLPRLPFLATKLFISQSFANYLFALVLKRARDYSLDTSPFYNLLELSEPSYKLDIFLIAVVLKQEEYINNIADFPKISGEKVLKILRWMPKYACNLLKALTTHRYSFPAATRGLFDTSHKPISLERNTFSDHPIYYLVKENNAQLLHELCQHLSSPQIQYALKVAACFGHVNSFEMLISRHNARIDLYIVKTALYMQRTQILDVVITHDRNFLAGNLTTAPITPTIIGWLVNQGFDLNEKDNNGYTLLKKLIVTFSQLDRKNLALEALDILLENGADPCLIDSEGNDAHFVFMTHYYKHNLKTNWPLQELGNRLAEAVKRHTIPKLI